jgi:hypothetical protein
MKTYAFSPQALARSRRPILLSILPFAALLFGVFAFAMLSQGIDNVQNALYPAALVLGLFGFGLYFQLQQQMFSCWLASG